MELGGRAIDILYLVTGSRDSEGLNGGRKEANDPVWVLLRDGPSHGDVVEDRLDMEIVSWTGNIVVQVWEECLGGSGIGG